MPDSFPKLGSSTWEVTRDALHAYSQIIGAVRTRLTPKQKHWWHLGLLPVLRGLSTGTLRHNGQTFTLELDMRQSIVLASFQNGGESVFPITGQSPSALWKTIRDGVAQKEILVEIDESELNDTEYPQYSALDAHILWELFSNVVLTFETFKFEQRTETGPILLWPHHFDIAMLRFTGNLVEGVDPDDEENADEQMNFGFITEGAGITGPYFYITAHPQPEGLSVIELPEGAYWHTEGWEGAVLPYSAVLESSDPANHLLTFFRTVGNAGKLLMTTNGNTDGR